MKNVKKILYGILVCCSLPVVFVLGAETVHFKEVSLSEGLSQSSVFSMLQDSKGFLWVATQDGLNRYDGYGFKVYKPEPGNPHSLSHNFIWPLCEDGSGGIWVGTMGGGLNRFDPRSERFHRYPVNPADPENLNGLFVISLYLDGEGSLWIASTDGGLSRLIRKPGQRERFIHYGHMPGRAHDLGSNNVTCLAADASGYLWVGTGNNGIKRIDPVDGGVRDFPGPSSPGVTVIRPDRSGGLWVGGPNGLYRMNVDTGTYHHYPPRPEDPAGLSDHQVRAIYEDQSGVLWVGTDNGLNRLDKRSGRFTRYSRNDRIPFSLTSNIIYSIYEDRSRILWLGTVGGGLNKFDREYKFEHYKSDPDNPLGLEDSFVYCIREDDDGLLWLSTINNGIARFNRRTGRAVHYRNIPGDPTSLSADFVRVLHIDRAGVIWAGALNGLNKLNREAGTFTRYQWNPSDPTSIGNNDVRSMCEDRAGNFWVGAFGGGLNKMNREAGTFTRYVSQPDDPAGLSSNSISTIYEAPSQPGILWIGARESGVNRFDPRTGATLRYPAAPDTPGGLSHNSILAFHEDRSGMLWTGTFGGGLNKMERKKDGAVYFTAYTEKEGLVNNTIYGILEDGAGHLWLSTNGGLSRFNPRNGKFRNYTARDGLQANEFNANGYFKNRNGEMFFSGINGVNAFFPSRIRRHTHVPPVAITAFNLFDRPTPIGGDSPLQAAVAYTERLTLNHTQNAFSFEFSGLDFTVPEKNKYAYKMEGLENDWHHTGAEKRFASYINMAPGHYVFRVKASNNDGVWNETGASLEIMITPPFWATWWFRLLALSAIMALVTMGYRKRLGRVRFKAELRTAHDAQMAIMPREDPAIQGFEISGACLPAGEVGGDFFDYIWLDTAKTRLGIAVADVSGKAMKSAMTAVMTSGMLYSKADEYDSVKEIMKRVNRPLYVKTDKKMFTALCLAALDIPARTITFSNAGLPEPLLKSGDEVIRLEGAGAKLPLGIKADIEYMEREYRLKSGDLLVFFTDGITEAKNPENMFYGFDTLGILLEREDLSALTAGEIKRLILADVKRFSRGAPRHDDMTVVVVKVL